MAHRRGRPQLYTDTQLHAALDKALTAHGEGLTRLQFDQMSAPLSAALLTRRLGGWANLKAARSRPDAVTVTHASADQLDQIFSSPHAVSAPRPQTRSTEEIFSRVCEGPRISGKQARAMIGEMFQASAYLTRA